MKTKSRNLHGNVPDTSPVALLLIDVINDLDFKGNTPLLRQVPRMARRLATLKQGARVAGVASIYVNDNFGKWQSDFKTYVQHCLQAGGCGKQLVQKLQPEPEDYFVLKPKHSGFYSTTLDIVLRHLQTHTLILTGIAGDRCVLFTANDAYLREYRVVVPSDCVISNKAKQNREALLLMKRVFRAEISPSAKIDFNRLKRPAR